jgi:hypothetical protein
MSALLKASYPRRTVSAFFPATFVMEYSLPWIEYQVILQSTDIRIGKVPYFLARRLAVVTLSARRRGDRSRQIHASY